MAIDRPEDGPVCVMAFSATWNELRERLEDGLDLMKHLIIGGPAG